MTSSDNRIKQYTAKQEHITADPLYKQWRRLTTKRICFEWSADNPLGFENFRAYVMEHGYTDGAYIDRANRTAIINEDNIIITKKER